MDMVEMKVDAPTALLRQPVGALVQRGAAQRQERAAEEKPSIPALLRDRLPRRESADERADEGRERAPALKEPHDAQPDVGAGQAGQQGVGEEGHG